MLGLKPDPPTHFSKLVTPPGSCVFRLASFLSHAEKGAGSYFEAQPYL